MLPRLFVIQPTLERLLSQRSESKYEYHRRHANVADCIGQITIHEKMDLEQPWHGEVTRLPTKEATAKAVREFLSWE